MVRQREQAVQELRLVAVDLGYLAHDRPHECTVRAREIEVHLDLRVVGVAGVGSGEAFNRSVQIAYEVLVGGLGRRTLRNSTAPSTPRAC